VSRDIVAQDRWSRWLLENRFGGDADYAKEYLDRLREVRDRVLDHRLELGDGAVLLDVGAGDGLIGFGALDRVGPTGRVIFSDVSRSLLEHCRSLTAEMAVSERCEFVEARAEALRPITDASVNAVTTRSVLIYVADKATAFREFYRVLKPGGRISLFEPINRYGLDTWRFDVTPVLDLAQRLRDFYRRLQPPDSDPMLDFDERRLVALCEAAGFVDIHLALHIFVRPAPPQPWDRAMSIPGNPNIPSPREAMVQIFTPEEAARYEAHVRPRVEAGDGVVREAVAYLAATKPERPSTPPGRDAP
jgi:arsenite methyltransferase